MKIAVMQPYFFPYIGYFQLINAVDKFIFFDVVQYIDRGWMNRNRILSQNLENEWEYITVPVNKNDKRKNISEVSLNATRNWNKILFGKLTYYKRIRAPYYGKVIELLKNITKNKYSGIAELNINSIKRVCSYLNLDLDYKIASKVNYNYNNVQAKDEWALEIALQEKAEVYINPIGGLSFFNRQKYSENGIEIKFLKTNSIIYKQSKREFVSNLSIIDVMMFNPVGEIKKMLDEYILI